MTDFKLEVIFMVFMAALNFGFWQNNTSAGLFMLGVLWLCVLFVEFLGRV